MAVGGLLIDRATSPDTAAAGKTAPTSGPPSAIEGDLYRPAGFFEDVVGGRAAPREIRYRLADGEKFVAELDWWPADPSDPAFLAGIGLERADPPAAAACAALPTEGTCIARADGDVVQHREVPASDVHLDPAHRRSPLEAPAGATVRGVTYLRADGWTVTVLVRSCSGDGSTVREQPPVTLDQLSRWRGATPGCGPTRVRVHGQGGLFRRGGCGGHRVGFDAVSGWVRVVRDPLGADRGAAGRG